MVGKPHQAMVPNAVVWHGVPEWIVAAVPNVRGEQYPGVDEELDLSTQRGGALNVEGDAVAFGVEIPEDRPAADKSRDCQFGFEGPDELPQQGIHEAAWYRPPGEGLISGEGPPS
ncbi:hypothetical protein Ate02nite_51550 [Paractinoplanes tereljensis]|uniref:Uncharacterized protein n=1 Tax=Paractinoplanes tereljensis TaxID=571912 RepID=A0A919NQJ4_9ACTN|nr:hypothetical protein Ate02nite_51550 [Actinoplanes tereljensis]